MLIQEILDTENDQIDTKNDQIANLFFEKNPKNSQLAKFHP